MKHQLTREAKQGGFTLIELLIAISILSMLMLTASYSYSLIANRWDKVLNGYGSAQLEAKNINLLKEALEGVQGYVVTDDNAQASLFFIGHDDSLLSITRSGLFSGEYGEIFRLSVEKNSNETYSLIYQATSTERLILTKTSQSINFEHEVILLSGLSQVGFSYFGWQNTELKSGPQAQPGAWYNRFSGIDFKTLPTKYELVLGKQDKSIRLPVTLEQRPELLLSPYVSGEAE